MTRREKLHLMAKPKLRPLQSGIWPEHRDGWSYVEKVLADRVFCEDGIAFVGSVEEMLYQQGPVLEPWVGVLHQVPHHDLPRYPDLARLLRREDWQASLPFCRGLWTLCNYTRSYLAQAGLGVPIGALPYVTPLDRPRFDWELFCEGPKCALHVGQYLRNFQTFYDLELPEWQKCLLKPPNWKLRSEGVQSNGTVQIIERADEGSYDDLLTRSVVVLDLKDAPANTAIVECMARATPICVNKVGGVAEYLGTDYPLYHSGDIASILEDESRIAEAHRYLDMRREDLPTGDDLIERMQSGAIYMSLPVPKSQQGRFRQSELTVLIAVYSRLFSLREQLQHLVEQENPPDFDVVLWNNRPENAAEVARISAEFKAHFPIHVIDSSENIYCAMRMAVPAFAHSETLLFCDDDVRPQPGYLRRMFDAHRSIGPRSAVCLRGHVIHEHTLDVDDPEIAWVTEENMSFHDQSAPDCLVDFAHADNFIISARLLREASTIPMTHPEYVLVDDYWLSYVLNAKLDVPIHKIEAPEIVEFTESAEDAAVALYHNPLVHEQRVRLYIEHMLAGWPEWPKSY